jgi:hypothetical protein
MSDPENKAITSGPPKLIKPEPTKQKPNTKQASRVFAASLMAQGDVYR